MSRSAVLYMGAAILVVLIVILVVLLSSKPWESDAYKNCVAEQKRDASGYLGSGELGSNLESAIEDYRHANYG